MLPIISVVGRSDTGKTALLVKLIPELRRRGCKVATIKHNVHGFDIDTPGKDSWKHAQAGADAVVIASPDRIAIAKHLERELTLDEIASQYLSDVDIVITEGFKKSGKPKIETHRASIGGELLCSKDELVAVVTDTQLELEDVPQFSFLEADKLAELIIEKFLQKKVTVAVSVTVNQE